MKTEDILALANAGFTAQQIAALNKAQLNAQYGIKQATAQPAQLNQVQQGNPDYVKDMIDKVFASAQAFNITTAQQPPVETAEDILATILNPKDTSAGTTGGVTGGATNG